MLKKNNIAHLFDNSWKFVILRLDKEKMFDEPYKLIAFIPYPSLLHKPLCCMKQKQQCEHKVWEWILLSNTNFFYKYNYYGIFN